MGTIKNSLNRLVAAQLANELVQEMAELEKHEAVINGIKEKIFIVKKNIIQNIIEDSYFFIKGKKQIVLHHSIQANNNTIEVIMTFGIKPEDFLWKRFKLTKKEEEILGEYTKFFESCDYGKKQEAGLKAGEIARKMALLKNRIELTKTRRWIIDLGDATEPGFFETSGLVMNEIIEYDSDIKTLEDYRRSAH